MILEVHCIKRKVETDAYEFKCTWLSGRCIYAVGEEEL
jgi:hypothetical protein